MGIVNYQLGIPHLKFKFFKRIQFFIVIIYPKCPNHKTGNYDFHFNGICTFFYNSGSTKLFNAGKISLDMAFIIKHFFLYL